MKNLYVFAALRDARLPKLLSGAVRVSAVAEALADKKGLGKQGADTRKICPAPTYPKMSSRIPEVVHGGRSPATTEEEQPYYKPRTVVTLY